MRVQNSTHFMNQSDEDRLILKHTLKTYKITIKTTPCVLRRETDHLL